MTKHLKIDPPLTEIEIEWHEKAPILYRFLNLYTDYESAPKDYGTSILMNMVEAHILDAVYQNQDITPSELAKQFSRTKGAVSQILKKLEAKELLVREKRKGNSKEVRLILTRKGKNVCVHHERYDLTDERQTLAALLGLCNIEDIRAFFHVLDVYNTLF